MRTLFLISGALCFLEKATTIGAQRCYFPDGSLAYRDAPCRAPSSNQASACCAGSDICLDNSLCLAQSGPGVLSRGTCTDPSWQSSGCAPYCQDVNTNYGAGVIPVGSSSTFCCGEFNTSSNACMASTQGSTVPFSVPNGRVIYNRTSGATLPIDNDIATVTILSTFTLPIKSHIATVTVSATATTTTTSTSSTICDISPCSSNEPTAVGVGVGVPLGLALLGALAMIWRQRSRELRARSAACAWEDKYNGIRKDKRGDSTGVRGQMHGLGHDCGTPSELDGSLVHEGASRL